MLRDLLKEGTIYTLANLATKGVSLLLIPFYTAYFSPADYGVLDMLVVFSGFVNAILSLQIGQGVSRYLADEKLSDAEKKRLGSTGINLIILFYIIGSLILWFSASFWTKSLPGENISEYIFKLAVSTIGINAVFYQLGIHLRFKRKTKVFAIANFLHAILNILLTFVFVSQFHLGIDAIYYASIIVAPLIVIIQFIAVRSDYLLLIGKKETLRLLKFSTPLIPAALAYIVLELTDRFFIAAYDQTLREVGIYGVGARFSSVVYLVITGFSMALGPIIYESHTLDSTKQKLRKLIRFYFLAGSVSVLMLGMFSYETLVVFTNPEYYAASSVMPFLYVSVFFTGIGMFSVGVHLSGKTYISSLIVIFSALLNLALNYLLIPDYGFVGAGLATMISLWVNHVIYYGISSRYYPFFSAKRVILYSTILLLLAFILVISEYLSVRLNLSYPILLTCKILIAVSALSITFIFYQKLRRSA